jgi:hypothetical protein
MAPLLFQPKELHQRLPTSNFKALLRKPRFKQKKSPKKTLEDDEEVMLVKPLHVNIALTRMSGKNLTFNKNKIVRVPNKSGKVVSAINRSVIADIKDVLTNIMIANISAQKVIITEEGFRKYLKQNYTNGRERIHLAY